MTTCAHIQSAPISPMPEADKPGQVCPECVAMGSSWVHLRHCRECGHVGCCDDSPNRHARAHYQTEDHPVIDSAEPRERWSYCYADDVTAG